MLPFLTGSWGEVSRSFLQWGGKLWPMTSLAALQHYTRFWGNSRHRAAANLLAHLPRRL
jgi:hypothetical protein